MQTSQAYEKQHGSSWPGHQLRKEFISFCFFLFGLMIIFWLVLCSSNAALLGQCTFGTNQLKGPLDMWETECVQCRWVLPPRSRPLATLWPSTRLFMWFLSNCIIWSKATGRLCPAAPTLLAGKKKGNIWQELTEPKWDHWLFWRRGVASHLSACCLIMLAELTIKKKKEKFFFSSHFQCSSSSSPSLPLQLAIWNVLIVGEGVVVF